MATITVGVGKDHATIQAAIDVALAGDVIEVYPGTYTKAGTDPVADGSAAPDNVTLRAVAGEGSEEPAVIDCEDRNHQGILCRTGWTIEGFDILNVHGLSGVGGGGAGIEGVYPGASSVTVRNVLVQTSRNRGMHQISGLVERCEVFDCAGYGIIAGDIRNCVVARCGQYPISSSGSVYNCAVIVDDGTVWAAIKIPNSALSEVANCVIVAVEGVTLSVGIDRSSLGTEYHNHFYGDITTPVSSGSPDGTDVVSADSYGAAFEDAGADSYYPLPSSPLIDAGADLSGEGFTDDLEERERPRGAAWDVGALEGPSFDPTPYEAPFTGAYGLTFDGTAIPGMAEIDLVPRNGEAVSDVERLALASVFTWKRADADADLPDPTSWRRFGFWADTVDPAKVANRGSLLWTLRRAVLTGETVLRVGEYLRDAFQWWIDEGIARAVDVQVTRVRGPGGGVLSVITIDQPNAGRTVLRWPWLWSAIANA